MSYDASLLEARPTLQQVIAYLAMSKATFYRHFRPAACDGDLTTEKSEVVWDYYTRRLDIREVLKSGCPTLTFDRNAVIALGDERRDRADGPLALARSARAARLGRCAESGFGSRVYKDGRLRGKPAREKTAVDLSSVSPRL